MNKIGKSIVGTALVATLAASMGVAAFASETDSPLSAFGNLATTTDAENEYGFNEALNDLELPAEVTEALIEADDVEVPSLMNIVLFGFTPEEGEETGPSKTISICTFDSENKQLRVSSILDNVEVEIEDHDVDAIGNAYKYGGAELAMQALNDAFDLDLESYFAISTDGIKKAIDIAGGVDVELDDTEAAAVNEATGSAFESGVNTLDGEQAYIFSQTEATGNNAVIADKWRDVMGALFNKMGDMEMSERLSVAFELLSAANSSLSVEDVMGLAQFPFEEAELFECVIPDYNFEADLQGSMNDDGKWSWDFDLEKASERLQSFVQDKQVAEDESEDVAENESSDTLFTGSEMNLTNDAGEIFLVKELAQGGWMNEATGVTYMEDINDATVFHGNDGSTLTKLAE